ncbi:hypothetical protein KIH41_00155 [Litoribacter ruber]|uniref:hypothetical protein n=1 Tax=Litoribacter ruber TaxID=702568 RepID=UPI001BDA59D7|nr:hypothetical protein [Litoribacter ruber]MBT0809686.1 hypothetical protein [Litoribacter ruber]
MVKLLMLILLPFLLGENWGDVIQSDQVATVIIYRKRSGMPKKIGLRIDGKQVIPSLKTNTYYEHRLDPGKVLLETKGDIFTELKQYSLTLEAGQTYYLEAVIEYQAFTTTMHLVRKSEKTAKEAIKNMKSEQVK